MAKGIEINGMLRGKRGGVVYSRTNGQQVSRARNFNPANPRTPSQLYQRAIMATVMRAYSAGKEIFDHSFQGKKVPMGNQTYFQSKNAKLLRQMLASDLAGTTQNTFKGVGPGTLTPVSGLYYVSEGSLNQNFFVITPASADNATAKVGTPAISGAETLATYMSRVGLNVGDIYTFVGFGMNQSDENAFVVQDGVGEGAYQPLGRFCWVRLIVTAPTQEKAAAAASAATLADFLHVDETSNVSSIDLLALAPGAEIVITTGIEFDDNNYDIDSFAIIRSEENSGLRSTEQMQYSKYSHPEGLDAANILLGWQQGTPQVGDSDLILEGAGF